MVMWGFRNRSPRRMLLLPRVYPILNVTDSEDKRIRTSHEVQHSTPATQCSDTHEMVCLYLEYLLNDSVSHEVPTEFICAITHSPMRVPVVASDGFTYEKSEIVKWLKRSCHSPCTRQKLIDDSSNVTDKDIEKILYLNIALKSLMSKWSNDHARFVLKSTINSALFRV